MLYQRLLWLAAMCAATVLPNQALSQNEIPPQPFDERETRGQRDQTKPAPRQGRKRKAPTTLEGEAKHSIIPESATLPARVIRLRTVYANLQSERGFDGDSAEIDTGLSVSLNFAFLALEYGVFDKLSAQLVVPWSLGGGTSVIDATAFENAKVRPAVEAQVDAGLESLRTRIAAGIAANAAAPEDITDPATGQILIAAGTPLRAGYEALRSTLVTRAITANTAAAQAVAEETTLQEGLGDVEIGAKYSLSPVSDPWFDEVPLYASVAGGVRFDTSGFDIAKAGGEIPVGRGTTDFGLRLNADWELLWGVQLQLENQTEVMIAPGSSWDKPEVDGGTKLEHSREGLRQIGYTKIVVGPGSWYAPLKFILVSMRYNWDNDPPTKTGEVESSTQVKRAVQAGMSLDGFAFGIPVQLDYDYVHALPSPNIAAAFNSHQLGLKLYYKF